MKRFALILLACFVLVGAGCGSSDDSPTGAGDSAARSAAESGASTTEASGAGAKTKPRVTVPAGPPPKHLEIRELDKGTGATAREGDEVTFQYVGVGYASEEEFDSSWSRNEPYALLLGSGQMIDGWEQGIKGMKVGGRRELIVPPILAYGPAGSSPLGIGPHETLIYVIDLLAVK